MIKLTPLRLGRYSAIPKAVRLKVTRHKCVVCENSYGNPVWSFTGKSLVTCVEHLHHIIPVRYVRSLGKNPHLPVNLLSCCQVSHGRFLKAEDRLWQGDVVSFVQILRQAGFPMDRLARASRYYKLGIEKLISA